MYQEILSLCQKSNVTLVVVSKNQELRKIKQLYDWGHRDFAENRVQYLLERKKVLPEDIRWHLIGHLQTNKVKQIVPFVHLIHSIDSIHLIKELEKQCQIINRKIDVLLQLKIATEQEKYGFDEQTLFQSLESGIDNTLPYVQIKGLMGMASFTDDKDQVRSEFKKLNIFFNRIKAIRPDLIKENSILSMGMSGDYELAIEQGSTMIRVGSAIFDAMK